MRYISSNDAAEILGVNISTLKRWTNSGVIECAKTAGGHRKFTMQNIRDFYSNQKQLGKNKSLGLENKNHKKIYELINKKEYAELSRILADASLESDDLTVNTVVNGCYMKGVAVEKIFDEIVEPGSIIVENGLRQNYITHAETFISRKMITRAVEALNQGKPNGTFNGKTALCVNFEDNLPDLGVVMSEIVLRHCGFNVLNTGSHAELGDLKSLIEKKNIDILLFHLCDMQCCMATIKDNLDKTAKQTQDIIKLSKSLGSKIIFGGSGLKFLPLAQTNADFSFMKYADLKEIVS